MLETHQSNTIKQRNAPRVLGVQSVQSIRKYPTDKDWICGAKQCLETFEMKITLEEILTMKSTKYKHIVKVRVQKAALNDLVDKQTDGKKGKCMGYKQNQVGWLPFSRMSLINGKKNWMDFISVWNKKKIPNNQITKSESFELSWQEPMHNEHQLKCVYLNEGRTISVNTEQMRNYFFF